MAVKPIKSRSELEAMLMAEITQQRSSRHYHKAAR